MPYDDYIVPELLPPYEDGVFKDEIERARFRSRRMFRMDMEHSIIAARDEGEMKGRIEEKKATAKNMLDLGYPVDEIIKVTGFTHEEVEGLREAD